LIEPLFRGVGARRRRGHLPLVVELAEQARRPEDGGGGLGADALRPRQHGRWRRRGDQRPTDFEIKQELAAAGYQREKIVLLAPTTTPSLNAESQVAGDLLRRKGFNVDYQALERHPAMLAQP
jgi:hypothetical protein